MAEVTAHVLMKELVTWKNERILEWYGYYFIYNLLCRHL